MRISLVAHGFPPFDRTGVENYTEALARAFVRAGHDVEVFAPRRMPELPEFSTRREERAGYGVEWITLNRSPAGPREMLEARQVAAAFGAFLERERPEIVHFQHVFKLGIGVLSEARKRGIPTAYTAHDYYPVCHRYTLLRPDLAHCDVRGDAMACAMCDLALGHLNEIEGLGDYQMGVLPEQLDDEQRAGLLGILAGEAERAGLSVDATDAAFDRRLELDALRANAFGDVDLVLAPTRFLADELVRGGVEREKIEVLPYGIENADLVHLDPPELAAGRPLRFAFFGGLSKHKGVHVLLEAWRQASPPGELSIWGYTTDTPYAELLRRTPGQTGVLWRGEYERADLPRLVAEADVVIVPSIWVENYPLVIREAFSAKRPVVAARFGALPESIRDEVDGLLYEPGDAGSLAAVLSRLAGEPELVPRLAAAIEPVKDVDEQARELLERYEELVARGRRAEERKEPLASLAEFTARYEALGALPARELFRRALTGLGRLSQGWKKELGRIDTGELLAHALAVGSRSQAHLRDAFQEIEWLRETFDDLQASRTYLEHRSEDLERSWLEALQGAQRIEDHLKSAEAFLEGKDAALQETRRRLEESEASIAEKNRHLDDAGLHLAAVEADLERALGDTQTTEAKLVGIQDELARQEREAEQAAEELRSMLTVAHERLHETEESLSSSEERLRSASEMGLLGMRVQERIFGSELAPLLERIDELRGKPGHSQREGFFELLEAARVGRERLGKLAEELAWRRVEMRRAQEAAQRRLVRALTSRTRLARIVSDWDAAGTSAREGEA